MQFFSRIVQNVVQAPNLAQILLWGYYFEKIRWPPEIQDGCHFFNMATIINTKILLSAINMHRLPNMDV